MEPIVRDVRCEVHGLAVGPDGHCVLCRDSLRAEGNRRWGLFLGLCLFALAAAAGATALVRHRPAVATTERSAPGPSETKQSQPALGEPTAGAVPTDEPEEVAEGAAPARETPEPSTLLPPAESESAAPSVEPEAPAASGERADGGAAPSVREVKKPPTPAELRAALQATSIVMFSASWCRVCTRARAFLQANGLSPTERDIDRDETARGELVRLTGRAAVPAFLIDGELYGPGFSEPSMTRALARSVERRLGVTGIAIESTVSSR